jgi:hypothetical protein
MGCGFDRACWNDISFRSMLYSRRPTRTPAQIFVDYSVIPPLPKSLEPKASQLVRAGIRYSFSCLIDEGRLRVDAVGLLMCIR